jgi:aspartyl-tRNA(Asn)/glutamyl-tRNA(Gln) amidotransferase subunit A
LKRPAAETIREFAASFRAGSQSPVAATKECLRRIAGLNPRLNAFITVLGDSAIRSAEESERRFRNGAPLGPLDGIPIAVKDLIYIEGVRCTAGSRILADNVAAYDAPVVRSLKEAGAVIVGTTNLHEFAAGVTSVNPHYGAVKNPWDEERVAGGSSGGSAVAVAAGMALGALGTDTAGSVRIPAALCGVFGLKPTYGRVSRLGVVPLASSLDTVGVLALSAWDTAAMLQPLAGHAAEDMTTVDAQVPNYTQLMSAQFQGARVGLVRKYFHDVIDPKVETNFREFVSRLVEIGCSVDDTELDGIGEVYERWLPIRRAEATAFHLRWLESSPELYGDDVRKLLESGRDVLAVDYVNAVNARPALMERFSASMKRFDFLIVPTTCAPAPRIGLSKIDIGSRAVDVYSALNRLTLPFNYVGFPVASIPSGQVDGLPVGVQIVGKLFDEAGVLRLAHAYEEKFGPYPLPRLHTADSGTA